MEKGKKSPQNNVLLKVPVRIRYEVLQKYLQEKLVGEKIKTADKAGDVTNYAEILGASLGRSQDENYDLVLNVEFKTLTSLFKNKKSSFLVYLIIGFDRKEQAIEIIDYKLEGTGKNWFINKSLQALANTFLYEKLKKKMNFDFDPLISKQLEQVNNKLANRLQVADAVLLSGHLNTFRIDEILPAQSHLIINVMVEGSAVVEISEMSF
ncbi:DUF4403 family protein [Salinimicrobium sp. GXAS 041]|uniref:DUF4403 family protein n=1 Tax=Salinimicrobium sp. GXAS 041 TaxID=3400806 RepID=UPI003C78D255